MTQGINQKNEDQTKDSRPFLAIIGASTGQLPLVKKAKELGIRTVCFAWPEGAVCMDYCDEFYPISIFDTESIAEKCKEIGVDGVVSTASEKTTPVTAKIARSLGFPSNETQIIENIQNKRKVRNLTKNVEGLSQPRFWSSAERENIIFPCVVKPITGSAKRGVSYCANAGEFDAALEYASSIGNQVTIEEFIGGDEFSVESLSFNGKHDVIQITRKVSTGFPHFAELEHHQPAQLSPILKEKVEKIIKDILDAVSFKYGASHIEIKIDGDRIYLIEINPRGGGDRISDTLIGLSTDFDYLKGIIDIALNRYQSQIVKNRAYAGILYLTAQNSRILKYFDFPTPEWIVEKEKYRDELTVSNSNYERDGYIIYQSEEPLEL